MDVLRKPVITNIDWTENGKIQLSFRYIPSHKQNIEDFELYYCYITSNDNNWYQYASNNWRSIHIASKQRVNKNIELRIATNKDIYDDNKNKNIELIMKLRCELKYSDWKWHSLMSEFSNIYYAQSMSIPSILNKQTQIDQIVNAIFNDNNDNDNDNAKQKLSTLYESFKDVYGVHNAFTKLIIKNIRKYYKLKCNQLLSRNINFISYLIEVEQCINHEKQSLFPCINKYIDDNKKQNVIKAIIDELFDTTNDLKIQQLIENKQIGMNQLFVALICDQQNAIKDLDRLLTFYGLMTEETQMSFDIYICNVIENLFINKNLNLSIFEMHNNISTVLNTINNPTYNHSLNEALNKYLEKEDGILSIINKLHGDDEKEQETAKQTMGELYTLYSNVSNGADRIGKLLTNYTKQYYKQKSIAWLNDFDAKQYLINAQNCIENEELLASYINHQQSCTPLMAATREELLKYHQDELLAKQTGLNYMLQNVAKEELSRLYKLYRLIPDGLIKIAEGFRIYIVEKGQYCLEIMQKQPVNEEKSDDVSAVSLFKLHDTMKEISVNQFENEQIFHKAIKDAFETIINRQYYTSSVLAKCTHNILLKGSKLSETEMEQTMDNIVTMYGYTRDKDIFERDYQTYFAKRLLENLYISQEIEKQMIAKLKCESGYHWTSKLDDMLVDIQKSREFYENFKTQYTQNNEDNDCNSFYVNVCTVGAWPTSSIVPIQKPMEIKYLSEQYTKYYLNKFSGRRLNFQMNKGTAEIEVQFNDKTRKILICSTYQMMILLLFNKKNKWTNKEIVNVTRMSSDDVDKEVYSLREMKIMKTKKIKTETDSMISSPELCYEMEINSDFTSKWKKIRIPKMEQKMNLEDELNDKELEALYRLRRHQLDAAIVRIMKARKTLYHGDLVTEIVKQLRTRFTPKPADCKKRIANLIELEYVERDEHDGQLYHYKM